MNVVKDESDDRCDKTGGLRNPYRKRMDDAEESSCADGTSLSSSDDSRVEDAAQSSKAIIKKRLY